MFFHFLTKISYTVPWNIVLEIAARQDYDWDFAFPSTPSPKDAPKNLASSNLFPEHVNIFIDADLAHGSMLGSSWPGKAGNYPWPSWPI